MHFRCGNSINLKKTLIFSREIQSHIIDYNYHLFTEFRLVQHISYKWRKIWDSTRVSLYKRKQLCKVSNFYKGRSLFQSVYRKTIGKLRNIWISLLRLRFQQCFASKFCFFIQNTVLPDFILNILLEIQHS